MSKQPKSKKPATRKQYAPQFRTEALAEWGEKNGVLLHFIPKGRPQSNSLIERFNRSFREDILNCYLFESLDEVRDAAWEWLLEYNEERHSGWGRGGAKSQLDRGSWCFRLR